MRRRFPQYLSSPFQVLWLESDELAIFFGMFTLALIFGNWFWLLTVAGPWFYSKLKKRYPRGFLKHVLYFIGLMDMKGYPGFFEESFKE